MLEVEIHTSKMSVAIVIIADKCTWIPTGMASIHGATASQIEEDKNAWKTHKVLWRFILHVVSNRNYL